MGNKNIVDGLTPSGVVGLTSVSTAGADIVALPLAARLIACAGKLGGKRALAEAAGMSESQLFRYLNGDSEMSAAKAVGLARAAGVDVGWLLTGEGQPEGGKAGAPVFRPVLMDDILRVLTEILVDFEWRLNPSQRAKFATYAYEALRQEELLTGAAVEVTAERLMEALWYFGKATFDELLDVHRNQLERDLEGHTMTATEASVFAQAVAQGHYQFYNSTGGDAVNRWLGNQVSGHSAERLLRLLQLWRKHVRGNVRWLDVGCGNGRELDYVLRHAPELEVYGTEIARAGLAHCQKLAKSGLWPEDRVVEGDATCLPFASGSMGMVYCRGVMHYLPYFGDPAADYGLAKGLRDMVRVLAPGGLLALSAPMGVRRRMTFYQDVSLPLVKELLAGLGMEVIFELEETTDLAKPPYQRQGHLVARKP